MSAARPLDRYPLIRAHDVEGAREAFGLVYSNTMTVQPLGRGSKVDVVINNCQLSQIGLNYSGYGADVRVHFSGSQFVTLSFALRGAGEIAIKGAERRLGVRCGLVTPAATEFSVNLVDNYEHVVLRLAPDALAAKLEALTGMPVNGPLRFDQLLDFRATEAKLLLDQFLFLIDLVSRSDLMLPMVVQAEFEQAMMVMFLRATRHNHSHLFEADAPDVAPAEVRRAEDFIEANWQQPITLEELAAVTGTSALSLFQSFKRHRGYTPMQFAEQVRARKQRPG